MHPKEVVEAYKRGENIIAYFRAQLGSDGRMEEVIETAYDLQAGRYVKAVGYQKMLDHKTAYGQAFAEEVTALTTPGSILEAGVGEGTTLSFVLDALKCSDDLAVHGFDISWSRIATCRQWLGSRGYDGTGLSVASLFAMPYADSCFDVVYTSHTIEPNGGKEENILRELYRVASQYLILLEPGYELASPEARQRMDTHGYCRGLPERAAAMGMRVLKHELFPHTSNPLNPTAITVIAKNPSAPPATPSLICPRFGDPLEDRGDSLFSPGSLRAYPKIQGLPCLRPQDGIIASAYEQFGRHGGAA